VLEIAPLSITYDVIACQSSTNKVPIIHNNLCQPFQSLATLAAAFFGYQKERGGWLIKWEVRELH
jgi:hypothetical protein